MCNSNQYSPRLTKSEVLGKIYEELESGHRSAVFNASSLSSQIIKEIKDYGLHVSIENDCVIIYW